jgi:hypothetical protein
MPATAGEPARPAEYKIKAEFLCNFTLFVRWDSACTGEVFTIGVLGTDPFGDLLDSTVAGQRVAGKPIRIARSSRPEDLSGSQVVFVARTSEDEAAAALSRLKRPCLLTVGEQEHFAAQGGVIEFVTLQDRVNFVINVSAARDAGLDVSSRLERVAASVLLEE